MNSNPGPLPYARRRPSAYRRGRAGARTGRRPPRRPPRGHPRPATDTRAGSAPTPRRLLRLRRLKRRSCERRSPTARPPRAASPPPAGFARPRSATPRSSPPARARSRAPRSGRVRRRVPARARRNGFGTRRRRRRKRKRRRDGSEDGSLSFRVTAHSRVSRKRRVSAHARVRRSRFAVRGSFVAGERKRRCDAHPSRRREKKGTPLAVSGRHTFGSRFAFVRPLVPSSCSAGSRVSAPRAYLR